MRILITGGTVVTMDPATGDLPRGDVLITDGVITEVAERIEATDVDEVIDAIGRVVLPGEDPKDVRRSAVLQEVSERFFDALDLAPLMGRTLTAADRGTTAAVINVVLARELYRRKIFIRV